MSRLKSPPASPPPAMPPQTLARLKVIKGPYKGFAYKLVAGKITIGRSSENDIVLIEDSKCSRKQALITLNPDNSYSIKDTSNRASVKVNDISKIQSKLQDGDLIQFGTSVLQFEHKNPKTTVPSLSPNIPAPAPSSPHSVNTPALASVPVPVSPSAPIPVNPTSASQSTTSPAPISNQKSNDNLPSLKVENPHLHFPDYGLHPNSVPPPHLSKKRKKKKSFGPKIILMLLALGGSYLFLSDSKNTKEKQDKLKSILEREEDVKTLSELREKEQEKRSKNALSNYKHAQFAYIKGIRDYRKGVYIRAIESFRVCKTLYPQHDLCTSYLKKAQVKNQQLIQAWMVAGKDYREKRRFVPCMASFKNVMMAVKDKQNLTYKEASENYKICQIQHEDRY